jgi:hypothetical protein
MDTDRIAKNLLENKLCTNCKHNMMNGCGVDCKDLMDTVKENIPPFPPEGTCERWEEKVPSIVGTIMQAMKAFGGLGISSSGLGPQITEIAKILEIDQSLKDKKK